jgi:hypothetical protein
MNESNFKKTINRGKKKEKAKSQEHEKPSKAINELP